MFLRYYFITIVKNYYFLTIVINNIKIKINLLFILVISNWHENILKIKKNYQVYLYLPNKICLIFQLLIICVSLLYHFKKFLGLTDLCYNNYFPIRVSKKRL